MNDIKTLKEINRLVKLAKSRKLAKALNNIKGGGHPKDAEKGRATEAAAYVCRPLGAAHRWLT